MAEGTRPVSVCGGDANLWRSGTLLFHCSVCANERAQPINRAHLVGEIFVMSLCGPRAVGEN